jgi:hypothetical protein
MAKRPKRSIAGYAPGIGPPLEFSDAYIDGLISAARRTSGSP